ncbi:MAG: hypothetical protein IJY93_07625 [Clostridia bacterium]|nr:hypothetical protein [Clostridia bacterium]
MLKRKSVAVVMLIVSLILLLSACTSDKTAKTADEFTTLMEGKGFTVLDVTEDTETNGLANAVLIAMNDNYQIEFYDLIDNESGEGVFYNNQDIFDSANSVKTMSTEVSTSNYNYYSFTGGDEFYLIARIDNTMLYCVAAKDYKTEIKDIVKELGY